MLSSLALFTDLPVTHLAALLAAALIAGVVRGFSGFGLSAVVMAAVSAIIPPVLLIPVCFVLESAASIVMFRGGIRDADMHIVWRLVIGSSIGVPIGLLATTSITTTLSSSIALSLILILTMAQLFKLTPRIFGTSIGTFIAGFVAGIATGLASIGGMVVALYVLAGQASPKTMRASLVMFLGLSMLTTGIYLVGYSMMDMTAFRRGLVALPFMLFGVLIGSLLFRPSLERFYRRACLILLALLALAGLAKIAI
jgi:uncharacterized membrane protein YfcA